MKPLIAVLMSCAFTLLHASGSEFNRAVIQAEFCGTCLMADVPIDMADVDCDIIVGHEWIILFCLVVEEQAVATCNCCDPPLNIEESLEPVFPVNGSDVTALEDDCDVPSGSVSCDHVQWQKSICMLELALYSKEPVDGAWTIFHSDIKVLC